MQKSAREFVAIVASLILAFGVGASITEMPALAQERNQPESERGEHGKTEGRGEHREGREGAESGHGEEGEESGVRIGRDETWDATRNGARLVLAFDAASNAFVGKVENTTRRKICAARVEVHLSTGTELGPTKRTDLQPGASASVKLLTKGEVFDRWTAHPEISACSGE